MTVNVIWSGLHTAAKPMDAAACFYACQLMHRRLVAPFYRFSYRVFYLLAGRRPYRRSRRAACACFRTTASTCWPSTTATTATAAGACAPGRKACWPAAASSWRAGASACWCCRACSAMPSIRSVCGTASTATARCARSSPRSGIPSAKSIATCFPSAGRRAACLGGAAALPRTSASMSHPSSAWWAATASCWGSRAPACGWRSRTPGKASPSLDATAWPGRGARPPTALSSGWCWPCR